MSESKENNSPSQSAVSRIADQAELAGLCLQTALQDAGQQNSCLQIDQETCAVLAAELEHWEQTLSLLEELMAAGSLRISTTATPPETEMNPPVSADENQLLSKLNEQAAQIAELQAQLTALHTSNDQLSSRGPNQSFDDPYLNRVVIAADADGNLKFPLDKNIVTIGREALNDIHIHSRFISRFHARIISDQHGAVIEDLDSRNGVIVNAQRVRRQQLRSGDLISVGRTQLKYIDLTDGVTGEGQA